jgi:hypothetical protein
VFLSILFAVLVAEAIVALISVGTRAYITGPWNEAGRISAVTAALAKVVEQETAKAFAQEQGRNLARKDGSQCHFGRSPGHDHYAKGD